MVSSGYAACAIFTRLGRCILFLEKLDNRLWNGRDVILSIIIYAAGIVCFLFFNILILTVWMPKVEVVTSRQCKVCVSRKVFVQYK